MAAIVAAAALVLVAMGASPRVSAASAAPDQTLSVTVGPSSSPVLNQTYGYAISTVNDGDVPLDNLVIVDTVPVQMSVSSVTTGSYTGLTDFAAGEGVRVSYEKNTAPGVFTLWGSSPNTSTNTTLTAPPPGLGAGEYITRVRWEFGQSAPGMQPTVRPVLSGQVRNPDNAGGPVAVGDAIQNCAALSAVYTAGPTAVNKSACQTFTLGGTGITISIPQSTPLGSGIQATATLTGSNPTGTITFRAFAASDANCSSPLLDQDVPVNGAGSYKTPVFTLPAGAYKLMARYNPDAQHIAAATGCNDPAGAFAVVAPPMVSASFGDATVTVGGSTALTFTITNPAANTVPLTSVALTDTLPAGLAVASPNGLTGSCGAGTVVAAPGSQSVTLVGGSVQANSSCSFSVDVIASVPGPVTNTTGAVQSANGGTGDTATATLTVVQAPAITSPASATFTVGQAGSFTVTASGQPTPSLSESGALPGGVSFNDNGDGSATLTGTPAAGSGGTYKITITAANGVAPAATQAFTLTVSAPPAAAAPPSIAITSPADGARYERGQRVPAGYACAEGAGGPGLSDCTGTVASGQPLDTGALGQHSFSVTAVSEDGQRTTKTVEYTVVLPDNHFTVRHVRAAASGRLRFRLTVRGPGTVAVLETAARASAGAARLEPKPGRFAFARKQLSPSTATTTTVTVDPNKRGRQLVARHPEGVRIRLTVAYTPTNGMQRKITLAIRIPGRPQPPPRRFTG